jgi:hypothetical protein
LPSYVQTTETNTKPSHVKENFAYRTLRIGNATHQIAQACFGPRCHLNGITLPLSIGQYRPLRFLKKRSCKLQIDGIQYTSMFRPVFTC